MSALSITATSVVPGTGAVFVTGVAGAAITAGQVCYQDPTTKVIGLFDADSATAAVRQILGVCVGPAVAAGQEVTVQILGQLAVGAILTKGQFYVGGATAGAINPTADLTTGWYANLVGAAISTSVLQLKPWYSGAVT